MKTSRKSPSLKSFLTKLLSDLKGDINAVRVIIPASKNSFDTSPILRIFSTLLSSSNPKSLFNPFLIKVF